MFGWFRRRLAPGGLGAVGDQPTEVRVEGHIASANELVSPLTGLRAAFFRVRVMGPVERVGIHTDLGAYRTPSTKTPDFRTRRDVGSVELVDLSLQEL